MTIDAADEASWATSGAMWLTGRPDGPPLLAPTGVVSAIRRMGNAVDVDACALLTERAGLAGHLRGGPTSAGGSARLLPAGDGEFVAVSLTRADDVALLPAWIGVDEPGTETMDDRAWQAVGDALSRGSAADLVARATTLGLAVSRRGETTDSAAVVASSFGKAGALGRPPVVVDLSSLWAGPLATRLLVRAGARVIKVESVTRPDGARRGDVRFFDLMNANKESVALDVRTAKGIAQLRRLLHAADVVVEASRPRALEQLGIDAGALLASGPRVWLSITGYGRRGPARHRIAFGDDAAVAGGLVADSDGPCFVADAVADPLTGIAGATAVLDALQSDERMLLDVALARVAAHVATSSDGPWRAGNETQAQHPVACTPDGHAPRLGEHSDAVLREFLD